MYYFIKYCRIWEIRNSYIPSSKLRSPTKYEKATKKSQYYKNCQSYFNLKLNMKTNIPPNKGLSTMPLEQNNGNLVESYSYRVHCDRCTSNMYKTAKEFWIDKKILSAYRLDYSETKPLYYIIFFHWKRKKNLVHFLFILRSFEMVRSCSKDDVQNVRIKVHFSHWMTANTEKNGDLLNLK